MRVAEVATRRRAERRQRLVDASCRAAVLAGGVLFGLFAGGVATAAAEPEAEAATVHRDWSVARVGDGGCLVMQQVHGRRTGALLVEVVLRPGLDDESVVMALRVPTGAHLPDGIAYRHAASDRTAVGLEWQQCSSDRCTAIAAISADEFSRMLRGRDFVVGYRPLPQARMLNVPVSLLGLTVAWREMAACQLRAGRS